MSSVRNLRESAGMTQAELASAAGTSQPTIAAYESGAKSPTLRTVNRLAEAAGVEAVVDAVSPMTREDRRSLFLHRAVAQRLRADPGGVLSRAERNLRRMRRANPAAHSLIDEWRRILRRPVADIVETMTDPRSHARELRHVTPFAGVLGASERARLYRRFRIDEENRGSL